MEAVYFGKINEITLLMLYVVFPFLMVIMCAIKMFGVDGVNLKGVFFF